MLRTVNLMVPNALNSNLMVLNALNSQFNVTEYSEQST